MLEKIDRAFNAVTILKNGMVEAKYENLILEDGKVISQTFFRRTIAPGDDYSQESPEVQLACQMAHTQEVIDAFAAKLEALNA